MPLLRRDFRGSHQTFPHLGAWQNRDGAVLDSSQGRPIGGTSYSLWAARAEVAALIGVLIEAAHLTLGIRVHRREAWDSPRQAYSAVVAIRQPTRVFSTLQSCTPLRAHSITREAILGLARSPRGETERARVPQLW